MNVKGMMPVYQVNDALITKAAIFVLLSPAKPDTSESMEHAKVQLLIFIYFHNFPYFVYHFSLNLGT